MGVLSTEEEAAFGEGARILSCLHRGGTRRRGGRQRMEVDSRYREMVEGPGKDGEDLRNPGQILPVIPFPRVTEMS